MQRRDFLGLGLAAPFLVLPSAHAAATAPKQRSMAYRAGMLPNVPLIAHTGEKFRFYDDLVAADTKSKTVLINYFVVGCTEGICAPATANLRKVQDMLGDRMGKDVFFYTITLQPKVDTVEILKEYAANFDTKPGWYFLTGAPADIDELRRAQGFYDRDPERDADPANHSGMARLGNERSQRWTTVSVSSSPANIYSTIKDV